MAMAPESLIIHVVLFESVFSSTCAPFQENKDNLDKALVGHSILEINGTNHQDCARDCMSYGVCKSFNYNRNERSCNLNDVDRSSVDPSELITIKGSIFSDINEWSSVMANSCSTKPCQNNQRCYANGVSYVCRDITCPFAQQVENGKVQIIAPGENNFRDKASLKCEVGYIPSQHEVECQASGQWQTALCEKLSDCKEILDEFPDAKNGLYDIKLWSSGNILTVNCDMKTDGGGWTLIHRRFDGSVDFFRNFTGYEEGFGNADEEFWLGLKHIKEIADQGTTDLRLDMTNENDETGQETFQDFVLTDGLNYTLSIGPRHATNLSIEGLSYNNGWPFTTFDRDLDKRTISNCAVDRHGAWWYKGCTEVNLNGLYIMPGTRCSLPGAELNGCGHLHTGFKTSVVLKRSSMMLRRN